MVIVRTAQFEDADKMVEVLRRSIVELCVLDHQNSPDMLSDWLANKTADEARNWISRPNQHVVVATINNEIVGVGTATNNGHVLLNYVSPEFRGQGVSKAVVAALEAYMASQGTGTSQLVSTATAEDFYRKVGYMDLPPHDPDFVPGERRMRKKLTKSDGASR